LISLPLRLCFGQYFAIDDSGLSMLVESLGMLGLSSARANKIASPPDYSDSADYW
jgi:hypothetical protein